MEELKQEETQQELFQEFSKEQGYPDRFPGLQKTQNPIFLSVTVEQVILFGIVCILCACFIFFLGVLRGKSIDTIGAPRVVQRAVQQTATKPTVITPPTSIKNMKSDGAPMDRGGNVQTKAAGQEIRLESKALAKLQSAAAKPYTIQLVTYKKESLAEKEVVDLRRSGYHAIIIPRGEYYVVYAGQYSSNEEAKKDLRALKMKYKDCFLTRR